MDGEMVYQPYGRDEQALYSISRNELNTVLLNAAEENGVRIVFSTRCLDIDLNTGEVRLEDASGRSWGETPTCTFGADGCFSTVRSRLQRKERFDFSQHYSTQGYCELHVPADAPGLSAWPRNGLHLWPRLGHMLITFPNRDGSLTCSLHLPFEGQPSYKSLSGENDLLELFKTDFSNLLPLVPDLATQFFEQRPNAMLTIRCSPWSFEDKVLLIGDSAHAILPSYGQGANVGFEDCAILDEIVGRFAPDWKRAFIAFEKLRKPETEIIADLCYEHFVELQKSTLDTTFQLRRRLERSLHDLFPSRFATLYSMVTFTSMPFSEALKKDREQQKIIDKLMRHPNIEDRLEQKDGQLWLEKLILDSRPSQLSLSRL
jgi:kynurenine 3-monooxygenase